jgi:ABC-type glycerol-3-phosphate transport system substrate-binding protein
MAGMKKIRRSYAMRKQLLLVLILSLMLAVTACGTSGGGGGSEADGDETVTFQATILEINEGYYLVEPVEGSTELNSADRITVPVTNMNPSPEPEAGDVLEIEYDGSIAESYPAQITNVYSISVVE